MTDVSLSTEAALPDAAPPEAALPKTALPKTERPTRPAMLRGWRRCCPACGQGRLMQGFLKVADHCPACGEELFHQRADDGPAYFTILIVGHLMAPLLLWSYFYFLPSPVTLSTAARLPSFSSIVISSGLAQLPSSRR